VAAKRSFRTLGPFFHKQNGNNHGMSKMEPDNAFFVQCDRQNSQTEWA
jgi:hypothetical protein